MPVAPRLFRPSSLLLTVGLLLAYSSLFAAPNTPITDSDLAPDPAVRWGRLDNGLRYAVLANREPKGRASLRLAVAAGSLEEAESQRGLAHFLEHMAFNGSQHYPPGTLVEFFQRLGMSFGGDTNAYTSFDRTVYMLELPDTAEKSLREGFTYFSDVAGGLLLLDEEINKERGVILSEKRARDSVAYRQFVGEFNFLLPESRFIQRLPIGSEEVISQSTRADFVDFYDTWYRPENMFVTVVGDFDPATVETILRETLAALQPRSPLRPKPSRGRVDVAPPVSAHFLAEPEAGSMHVTIQTVMPYQHEPDTAARRLAELPRELALRMLNRRLSILSKKENASFIGGSVGVSEPYDFARNASIELTCAPDRWTEALAAAEQELRRALSYGFQPGELREAVADTRNELLQAVLTAPTRHSSSLASELVDDFLDRTVFTHPEAERDLYLPALEKITPADCLAALHNVWPEKLGRRLWLTGNADLGPKPEAAILAAYATSQAAPVSAPPAEQESAFAYTDFGQSGKIVHETQAEDLGISLLQFANGVRLNLKPTDFEANQVRVGVRVGGGLLSAPKNLPGLPFLTSNSLLLGGLGRHSADDLSRVLAGRTVGSNFSVGDDAFIFSGSTNRDDLLLQLQLLCAYLTDPGYRPEGLRVFRKNAEPFFAQMEHNVQTPLRTEIPRLLAGDDSRFGLPTAEAALARTDEEARAWLAPAFSRGPIEVAIVGDFDSAAACAAVAATFGALPSREDKPAYEAERRLTLPASPLTRTFNISTEIPKGIVQLNWPATDGRDIHIARRLHLLAAVLQDRLRIKLREEMGDTYSPNAGASLSDTFAGMGYLQATAVVSPDQARIVLDAMRAAAANLQRDGVTEDELARAKQPLLTQLRQSARNNAYWLGSVLASAQEQPQRLDWARDRLQDVESTTSAEVSALAKQYLHPQGAHEFVSLPASTSKEVP